MIKSTIKDILKQVNCAIDKDPDTDIQVLDETIYDDIFWKGGSLAIGEGFMKQKIVIKDFENTFKKLYTLYDMSNWTKLLGFKVLFIFWLVLLEFVSYFASSFYNSQTVDKSADNIEHYNIGTELYESFLGKTMQYSCGYYRSDSSDSERTVNDSDSDSDRDTLDQAQLNKMDKIINKLHITDGMHILEIGSGYGTLSNTIIERYPNCKIIALNISVSQITYAQKHCTHDNCSFLLKDYRELKDSDVTFDRIVSVGMFEHVGKLNYKMFFEIVNSKLKPEGLFLLHSIVSNNIYGCATDPWLHKYIFHNGVIPNLIDMLNNAGSLKCEDVEDFGLCYASTLTDWLNNFNNAAATVRYEDTFRRMWVYYFNLCIFAFKHGNLSLKQVVFSKNYKKVYVRE